MEEVKNLSEGGKELAGVTTENLAAEADGVEGLETDEPPNQGKIEPDSLAGRYLGFTSDRFDGWLWEDGKRIWISFIESKQQGQGHLSQLFRAIEDAGYYVAVPTPFAHMEAILRRKGFEPHVEDVNGDVCEVWYKPDANTAKREQPSPTR